MVLTFYRVVAEAPSPVRGDAAALGTMPTRAYRYCEALRQASAMGWYVFPPRALSLLWDGQDVSVSLDDGPFMPGGIDAMPYPGLDEAFDALAPAACAGAAPPWITVLPEPGTVQIWTGFFARTEPGWSCLVRAPANLPRAGNYECFEGLVDTDSWFGPLFINIRLTRTDVPVRLNPDWPLAMVVPVRRSVTLPALEHAAILELDAMDAGDWELFDRSFASRARDRARRPGTYAAEARRRAAAISSEVMGDADAR